MRIRQMQFIFNQRHNRSGCQQKECRAKHNRAIKFGKFTRLVRIGPEPHQQKPDDQIL